MKRPYRGIAGVAASAATDATVDAHIQFISYAPAMDPAISKAAVLSRRDEILAVAARYGAYDVRLFGSVARGDADFESDVDFVVRFEPDRSLFDQGGMLMDLRELLGVKVDLVSEGALTGRFGEIVRREAVPL